MSSADEFTLGEMQRTLSRIEQDQGKQLGAIASHLKELNGAVARHELSISEQKGKTTNLEREVFRGDRDRRSPPQLAPELAAQLATIVATITADNAPALTKRDVAILGAAGKAVWAVAGAIASAVLWIFTRGG